VRRSLVGLTVVFAVACGQRLEPPDGLPNPTSEGGAPLVSPEPQLEDPGPAGIRRVDVLEGNRRVRVVYTGGDHRCYGLHHVDVEYRDRLIVLAVYEGRRPGADMCTDIGIFKVTEVSVREPVAGRRIVDALTLS
jgi:hypothetical protein